MTGWFVKGGIDDVAFQPLIGLYKTQVRQLSPYLGMPAEIQDPLPSPDMIKGIGDEAGIGIRYSRLDVILDALDRGLPDEEIVASGIGIRELSLVREMNRLSSWKRESEHAPPPVEGGLKGGLRIPSSEGSPTPCTTRASQRSAASQSSSG
jgi:NAD+ synthase